MTTPDEESESLQGRLATCKGSYHGNGNDKTQLLLQKRRCCLSEPLHTEKWKQSIMLKMCVKDVGECNRDVWCTTVEQETVSPQTVTNTLRNNTCSHIPILKKELKLKNDSHCHQRKRHDQKTQSGKFHKVVCCQSPLRVKSGLVGRRMEKGRSGVQASKRGLGGVKILTPHKPCSCRVRSIVRPSRHSLEPSFYKNPAFHEHPIFTRINEEEVINKKASVSEASRCGAQRQA